nr:hypothetical protein [Tanacetum cinerariifolium]
MLESKAYKTYYTFASGEKTPKPKYVRKKVDSDTSPKQKPVQATKGTRIKTKDKVAKSEKMKQPANKPKAKRLAMLSKVALTEAEQLKLPTKRRKKYFHISHASGSGDGVDTQLKDDDENNFEEKSNIDDDDSDDNDESDDERTKSVSDVISDPNKTNEEHDKEEEYDNEFNLEEDENIDEEEDDEVTKELYKDVNVNLGNKDVYMTYADQANNEIASLMDTTAYHATTIPEITPSFTKPTPPPPLFFNPPSQQATPTSTPTSSETTISLPALLDFTFVFKFNERVTNLEKDLSKIKQVNQYAQALSSIPAIVNRYMDNKLGEAIDKAIQAHNFDCREEAQAEKREYIKLVDLTMRTIIKEEVNA